MIVALHPGLDKGTSSDWRFAMPRSNLSINTATIPAETFLPEKLELIGQAGFDGVGLWKKEVDDYLGSGGSLDGIVEKLSELGLSVDEFLLFGGWWNVPPETKAEAERTNREVFEMASALGARLCITCAPGDDADDAEVGSALAAVCDLADEYGLRVGFEFIGAFQRYRSPRAVVPVLDSAGRENVGIVFDTFHFYKSGEDPRSLSEIDARRVSLVHLNDSIDLPLSELNDSHRTYPGEGVMDVASMVRPLLSGGFDGPFSVEVFGLDGTAEEIIRHSYTAARKCLDSL